MHMQRGFLQRVFRNELLGFVLQPDFECRMGILTWLCLDSLVMRDEKVAKSDTEPALT